MKKKRIEQNEIKRYFLIIAAFLSFMILSLLFFLSWLQQDVEVSSRKTVATNVERQSYHLKSVLDIQFNYLTGMASYMGEREDLFCQENKRLIQSIVKEQDLDLIGIMKADGDTYYNNGARKNVKNRGYFKKVMQGQKIMSQPLESKVDGRTKVILVVPIYRNGKVTGALGASYNVGALNQMLFNDIYDGIGFSMIIDTSGKIISCDSGLSYRKIGINDNVYDFYTKSGEVAEETMKSAKANIKKQKSGILVLKEKNAMSYLAYEPLHINNWMLCYMVPQSKAQEEFQFIGNKEVILFAVIGVGVITFFILIFQRTSMKQKKMREIASRDGLTQLYNKAGTEQRIKEWLHSDRSKAGAVLMMMDIDYFKQINDTYGHAVGDRVLYKVGHLLKSSFRENDIVGRIGGDEFLIFMEGITSEEFAVRRMENLQQYFRELPIEELEEHTLTCSMERPLCQKMARHLESCISMLMKHFIQQKEMAEMDLESIMRWKRKKYRYFIQIPRKNLLIFRKFNGIKGEDMVLCCM